MDSHTQATLAKAFTVFAAGSATALWAADQWARKRLEIEQNVFEYIVRVRMVAEGRREMEQFMQAQGVDPSNAVDLPNGTTMFTIDDDAEDVDGVDADAGNTGMYL